MIPSRFLSLLIGFTLCVASSLFGREINATGYFSKRALSEAQSDFRAMNAEFGIAVKAVRQNCERTEGLESWLAAHRQYAILLVFCEDLKALQYFAPSTNRRFSSEDREVFSILIRENLLKGRMDRALTEASKWLLVHLRDQSSEPMALPPWRWPLLSALGVILVIALFKKTVRKPFRVLGGLGLGTYLLFPLLDPSLMPPEWELGVPSGYEMIFKNFNFLTICTLIVAYASLSVWGWLLIAPYLKEVRCSIFLKLMAGALVGYIGSIGVLRLLSLWVPTQGIFLAFLVGMLVTGWLVFDVNRIKLSSSDLISFGFLTLLFCFILVVNVHALPGHPWTGHGEEKFANLLTELKSTDNYFPLLSTHYEEVLFNYWLSAIPGFHGHPVILFWITNSLLKTSACCCLYILFCHLGIRPLLSVVFSGYIVFGGFSTNYLRYYLLVDTANPIYLGLFPGRYVWIVFGIAMLALLGQPLHSKRKPHDIFLLTLIGLSLPASALHNTLFVCFLFVMAMFFILNLRNAKKELSSPWVLVAIFSLVTLSYYWRDEGGLWLLLLAGLVGGGSVLKMVGTSFRKPDLSSKKSLLLPLLALIGSSLLLGNFTSLNSISSRFGMSYTDPFNTKAKLVAPNFTSQKKVFNTAVEWQPIAHGGASEYFMGMPQFFGHYGLIFMLCLLAIYVVYYPNKDIPHRYWYLILVTMATLVGPLFVFIDHYFHPLYPWLRTRVIEYPIYVILFGSLYCIGKYGSSPIKRLTFSLSLIATVLPFLHTDRWLQWWMNFQFLRDRLF